MGHFARLDHAGLPDFSAGSVWLVGAGPGAPGLLSLLAYHGLGQADVIVHDALVSEAILAFSRPDAEIIQVGKRGGKPSAKQDDITLTLVEKARDGKRVLRLKGGDPFMFGRGGEECAALVEAAIPFRIVPGITAGIGGLGYAGIPVTHRDTNHAVIFLTGHDDTGGVPQAVDWGAIATAAPVIVMYMAIKHLGSIADKLMAAGRDPFDPLSIVAHATLPHQRVIETTLGEAGMLQATGAFPTPAIVVLGPVSGFRASLDWYLDTLRENGFG
ncbi:uroporphyrinogen-III C-methyltransferase [Pelagibacterium montanilacus]|uniref:uroporphyrinogen-III C-methyltransferase n=1 Tax=Pelagibacterium montanilacus TaxID=2185280 RepID=UPI000F8DE609|nr:uroporphyrinogen-III C-methyltransferase [Pelagibacterium montanilacus]